jgi:hypothetical protein
MAIEDLDLEFEDEEEKEKSDALDVDVDLSFSAHDGGDAPSSPATQAKSGKPSNTQTAPNSNKSASISEDDVTDPNLRIPAEMQSPSAQTSPTPKDSPAKASVSENKTSAPKSNSSGQNVAQLSEARIKAQQKAQPQAQNKVVEQVATPAPAPDVNAVLIKELEYYRDQVEKLRTDMDELKSELFNAKKDSEIKVAVAEMKAELMIEVRSGGEVMEHKVNQILQRIHKKVPALKGEVLTIKKAVNEYLENVKKKK